MRLNQKAGGNDETQKIKRKIYCRISIEPDYWATVLNLCLLHSCHKPSLQPDKNRVPCGISQTSVDNSLSWKPY